MVVAATELDEYDGVIIRTERLTLSTLKPNVYQMTPRYLSWLNDPEVTRYLECRHEAWTMASMTEYVANNGGTMLAIAVRGPEGARHIGNLRISPPLARHPAAEISIMIGDKSAWGQGYAPEAIRAATAWAWQNTGIRKLWAGMYAANTRSKSAFLKAGYAWEACHFRHYMLDGEMVDVIELGACKPCPA